MSAGEPNWQKIAQQRLTLNQKLRKKLGLKERKDGLTNFAQFSAEIHEENLNLDKQINKANKVADKPVKPKIATPRVTKREASKVEEEPVIQAGGMIIEEDNATKVED